jgi:hypothetical protein
MSWLQTLQTAAGLYKDKVPANSHLLAHEFLEAFYKSIANEPPANAGNRRYVPNAIEQGLDSIFSNKGWTLNEELQTISHGNNEELRKTVDRAYEKGNRKVFIEVKSTLEFNNFSAAFLEALFFKNEYPDSIFILFSLVTKMTPSKREAHFDHEALKLIDGKNPIDHIICLSPNPLHKEADAKEHLQCILNGANEILIEGGALANVLNQS